MAETTFFKNIFRSIEKIFKHNGYKYEMEFYKWINGERVQIYNKTNYYTTYIVLTKDGNLVGSVQGTIQGTQGTVNNKIDSNNVSFISIEEDYQGKDLGFLMLMFFISYSYIHTLDYKYITLNNDSDRAGVMNNSNLYYSIGFRPTSGNDMEPERRVTYSEIYNNREKILEKIDRYKQSTKQKTKKRQMNSSNKSKSRSRSQSRSQSRSPNTKKRRTTLKPK